MILLSYFHRIIGPYTYLSNPESLIEDMDEETLKLIRNLLDSTELGYFSHYFSVELKTVNLIFEVNSAWARGRFDLAMISIITREETPDNALYEKKLSKFVDRLKAIPDIYKGFYIKSGPKDEAENIKKMHERLKEELENLSKIISIKTIESEGQLVPFLKLKDKKVIELSNEVIQKIRNLTEEDQNCFIVFRTIGESIKLDMIPLYAKKIIRLAIIFSEQVQLPILHRITQILSTYKDDLTLVFTSGICQDLKRCIYEVYIDTEMNVLNEVIEKLYEIPSILEIEVKLIGVN